jgi:hypothetical protein
MTDLQDRILDRLVGTPVGVNWPGGPLAIAAEVVGGRNPVKFGQTDNDRGAKSEIARRLGYPVLLCEAIQGANRGLGAEDDRRSLAMALFGTIPVGGRLPRLSAEAQNRVALRLAVWAHPYVCRHPDCPVPAVLAELAEAAAVTVRMAREASLARCDTAGGTLRELASAWLTARSSAVQRVVQSAAMALRGFELGKSVHGWCSVRESARLAASERGVGEAVDCCVEVARRCGLAV